MESTRWLRMAFALGAMLGLARESEAAAQIEALDPPDPRAYEAVHLDFSLRGCRTPDAYPTVHGTVIRLAYDESFDPDFCVLTTRHTRTLASLPPGTYRVELGPRPVADDAWQPVDAVEFVVQPLSGLTAEGTLVGTTQDLLDLTGAWRVEDAPGGHLLHLYSLSTIGPFDSVIAMFQRFDAPDRPTWSVFQGRREAGSRDLVGELSSAQLVGVPGQTLPQLQLTRVGAARLSLDSPSLGTLTIVADGSGAISEFALARYRHR
jgi:hypothetical protein